MFTISKQNINAEVTINAGHLRLNLLDPDYRFEKAHTAILHNINILAQIHLGRFRSNDVDAVLTEYFILHGWSVDI